MINQYLRAFVIGSSFFVFFPYFFIVSNFEKKMYNFSYKYYTFLAPIALGLMNVFSLIIANYLNLSKKNRFLLMSILSPAIVASFALLIKAYNFKNNYEVLLYIIKLFALYYIVFNYIIFFLDEYV